MGISDKIKATAMKKAYDYLDSNPKENMPKLLDLVNKYAGDSFKPQRELAEKVLNDPDNIWNQWLMSLWDDIDPGVRKTIFQNFVINAGILGMKRQDEVRAENHCNVPWAILLDPTSACNLHCTGCWAADYGNKLNLDFDTLDDIINQGTEMGTYMYIFTGGEPLVRKDDIIKLCEKHPDCAFTCFTNGTLIDQKFCDDLLRVKNFVPAISVEGFEKATDFRRGDGTFQRLRRGMELLRKNKLPFGVSCCYTSANCKVIGSEEYFDAMIEWGAKFCWLFTFMPVGVNSGTDLMVSAEQRKFMYEQIRKFRKTKPIFTMDFWNDGEYVNGCIAGGRYYLHINANGDIEPCAFVHYSDSNIHDCTLLQAYKNPIFMQYHDNQPFNNNYLRPCPVLDNPDKIREMVKKSGAKSTDYEFPENVDDLAAKCDDVASKWAVTADEIWDETAPHKHRNARVPL